MLIGLTLLLLISGFASSFLVKRYEVKFLKVLPLWFLDRILKFATPERSLIDLTLFIFGFNSIAIFLYMCSGILIIGPYLIAFLTGMNIGIILIEAPEIKPAKEPKAPSPFLLLTPVIVVIELSVFCFALAMGMSMALELLKDYSWTNFLNLLIPRAITYLRFGPPLLLLSAILEAKVIKEVI